MRFKLDENLPTRASSLFEDQGHDVETAQSQELDGAADADIAEAVRREDRILVSLDTDFGDIRRYPPEDYPGFVLLRPEEQDVTSVTSVVRAMLPTLSEEFENGSLWIVEDDRIRIRE